MKLIYSGLLILVASACTAQGGSSTASRQDARRAFQVAATALRNVEQQPSGVAPVTANIDVTTPCTTSGALTITGSFEGNDAGTDAAFDLTASFDACAEVGGVLDGDLAWQSSQVGDDYTASLDGSLALEADGITATCTFDLGIEVHGGVATFTGSVCGFDPDELELDVDSFQL